MRDYAPIPAQWSGHGIHCVLPLTIFAVLLGDKGMLSILGVQILRIHKNMPPSNFCHPFRAPADPLGDD